MSFPRPLPKDCRSGFALLITITLLAFLVLLLVSLASLTRVETQVASNTQQLSKARQNALLALNIALGQLQLTLGPDQRVSVPAAQQGDGTASYAAADADNNAHWAGVYRQDPTTTTRSPQLLSWLVSGNQDLTISASGANSPTFIPSATVSGLSTTMSATTPVTIGTSTSGVTKPAVLLVGPGSTSSASIDNFVVAPLQNIQVPANTIAGLDPTSTTATTIGHYAYWVGDEGVKANISLTDPWAASAEKAYSLRVAQRAGIELVDSSTAYSPSAPISPGTPLTAYPATDTSNLSKILDLKQLPMANTVGQATLTDAVKYRYHDLTASSQSVLADVAKGGLKKDLTAWLEHPTGLPATAPTDNTYIASPLASDTTGYGLPRWGIIRSYAGFENGVAHAPQQQTSSQEGFSPVITYFRIGFSASCDEDSPTNPTPPLRIHVYPIVVLWNPYDTPIAAAQYELAYGLRWNTATGVFIRPLAGDATSPSWDTSKGNVRKGRLIMNTADMTIAAAPTANGAQETRRYFRFLVDTQQLGPGESRVYTLDDEGGAASFPYTAGTSGKQPNRMSANVDYNKGNSAYFESPDMAMTPTEIWIDASDHSKGRKKFYVLTNGGELEFGLFPALPAGANPTVAEMIASTPYQLVQHIGIPEYTRLINPVPTVDMDDSYICAYHWAQLQMSLGNKYFRTTRWLAQSNPSASLYLANPNITPQVYPGSSYSGVPSANSYDGNQASAGESFSSPPVTTTAIIGFPSGPVDEPWKRFFSLAQLQHANVSLLAQNPAYAIGNSEASYFIYRSDGSVGLTNTSIAGTPLSMGNTVYNPANQLQRIYDLSYVLNQELWDHYYFSTIPASETNPAESLTDAQIASPAYHLPNTRHVFLPGATASDLIAAASFDTAAAHLLVNGGFNVNSASEQAWRALLASHNNLDTASGGFKHPFARLPATSAGDPANQSWTSSYRILSDAQIKTLARAIMTEVKTRGPFLSLADFVNRRLSNDATGYNGTLQAAINSTDADTAAANRINDSAPFNDYSTADPNKTHRIVTYASTETGTTAADFQQLMRGGATTNSTPSASRAAFGPGFLTQADLLQSIGPVLSARSDTFVIRAYGDVQNAATTAVESKAWCEAIIQRMPDYINASMPAETDLSTAAASTAKTTNQTFGRRFKIVSFRWLTANDI